MSAVDHAGAGDAVGVSYARASRLFNLYRFVSRLGFHVPLVTLAFIGTNLMEIVSPHGRGLGALFDSGKTNSDYPLMFAVLIALAVLGIVRYYIVVALERVFAGWAERAPE